MTLADKADKLIELWVRELAQESANPYKAQSLLDGHYALEVGGKKNPLKSYINAKETKSPPRDVISSDLILIDSIIGQISKVNSKYPLVLKWFYSTGDMKRVAKEASVSLTKARELKNTAFDLVQVLLDEKLGRNYA